MKISRYVIALSIIMSLVSIDATSPSAGAQDQIGVHGSCVHELSKNLQAQKKFSTNATYAATKL